jgi:uncharacterized protein involved in exopolysaccharide biosynthesis/Mrp family chromosome partitioning ATPase
MLVYDQPIGETKSGAPRPQPLMSASFSVLELSRVLWRRRVAIAMAGLLCACLAVIISKSLTPKYLATAQLYVDPRELQLVDRELTPRAQDVSGLAMVVESQARLITSNSVLLQVIQDNNLDKDPEFGGGSGGIKASLLGLLGLETKPAGEVTLGQTVALEALNRHINVRKTDRTFIVDIEVWSFDPAKAAMLANAISNAYLAESRSSQATAARRATTDLSGRLKELQQRLRNAENAVAVYKAQNNFVGTQDTLISDQQLSASNQRLAAARAATLDAQAKYDQIEATRRASADGGAIPEALQSPTIANLRAQYAEARKRYAEMSGELGPLHPALRQIEKQVEDLRRTINEEVDRFAQSAKNDLTRARDYEAALKKSLSAQQRQSVDLSQASVRLRELERDVEASRDVYQSFLKRSRETEEQESLNTSSARIIGEATVPQRRMFPPAMSLVAALGFMFGVLGAAAWVVAAARLHSDATEPRPNGSETRTTTPSLKPPTSQPTRQLAPIAYEKPLIARLRESDVMRTLSGILASGGVPDVTRWGWPTLRAGVPQTEFLDAMREVRANVARHSAANATPVMVVMGAGSSEDRSIVALNIALAAARDGAKVLLIDADHVQHVLSNKIEGFVQSSGQGSGKSQLNRLSWLNIGTKASFPIKASFPVRASFPIKVSPAIQTVNGIALRPAGMGADAIRDAVAEARSAGSHDLVILDGPAMPWSAADHNLLDMADGLVAVLPASLDVNECMEDIITALGDTERKLAGVVLSELHPTVTNRQRDKQYA